MSSRRFALVFRHDLRHQATRPILWILILLMGVTAWGLSQGDVRISSGSSTVGGTKAWITSEFNNAKLFSMEVFLFYSFFLAVVAGMAVLQDDEQKVGEILHAMPLRPREYLWGRFLSVMAAFLGVMFLHILLTIFFNHVMPNPKAVEVRGPLNLMNYLRPAFWFGLPTLLFVGGTAFAIGERTRKPILVFFLPVAAVIFCGFFVWSWAPSWLDPRLNRLLMWIDPAGVRWLSETWLKVDRGVEFYNHAPVGLDAGFVLTRVLFAAIGLGAVAWSERHFARSLRGAAVRVGREKRAGREERAGREGRASQGGIETDMSARPEAAGGTLISGPLPVAAPGLWRGAFTVLRFEFAELRTQPGLYLFVPMILLQTLGNCLTAVGAFDTPVLSTPGLVAVRAMNTLTLLVAFLMLFYTVESFRRERNTGLFQIYFATPARTASILLGKIVANAFVGVVVTIATFVGAAIAILSQGKVLPDPGPFLLVWGLLMVPTFLLWTSFVMLLFALTNNRYVTYALGLAALALTGLLQMLGKMNWAGNWDLWSTVLWSDLGALELDRPALWLNRIGVLGLTALFVVLTLRCFPRRDRDATRTLHRLAPGPFLRGALRVAPFAVVPVAAIVTLWVQVNQGFQGKATEKLEKDYWKQNLATWRGAPNASIAHVDLFLDLDPAKRSFQTEGAYRLTNERDKPLRQIALTGATHWQDVTWTMNGAECKPEDRSRLYVFTPETPLAPGDTLRIGFRFHGRFPQGITKNGGGVKEFILPSGVVLTSFTSSFAPLIGWQEEIGRVKDNSYETRIYPEDWHREELRPALGSGKPFTTRIRLRGPAEYTLNSVGVMTSEETSNGRRTVLWESDQPVRFFNVVAGRWEVSRGEGTAVYHSPRHRFNVAEMSAALGASRRWYSEWFWPYPWSELKLSEFPALAHYAQGFPTNITFSEGIGFLTKSDSKSDAAYVITAHEAAHQWWGNLLTPGEGPGADVVAEGMSHFSTLLLLEQEKGPRARIEFAKRIEERYGDRRQVDSERPLVRLDGSRAGDETAIYDKGGWAMWMLLNYMGREQTLSGLHRFVEVYKDGPDYPLVEDLLATLRPFAPDSTGFDQFTQQWFFSVVVPEYRIEGAERIASGPEGVAEGGENGGAATWTATARVKNRGTGRMPVEIAAVAGERFTKKGEASPDYREARTVVTLGAGEELPVEIACDFKPERIVVDPDALVLQLMRKQAVAEL